MKSAKRILAIALAAAIVLCMAACAGGNQKPAESSGKKTPVYMREGYVEEHEHYGISSMVHWVKNGDLNIYGHVFIPNDFDSSKQYPILIMSHGHNDTGKQADNKLVQNVVKSGMICYTFDFCGGSVQSKSDGKYPEDCTVENEVSDLKAVIDDLRSQSYVDTSKIALFGSSMGGAVTTTTAGECADKIAAVILQAPAFNPEQFEGFSRFAGDFIMLWGTEDSQGIHDNCVAATEYFGDRATFYIVEGAPHSFQPRDYELCMGDIDAYLIKMGVMPEK